MSIYIPLNDISEVSFETKFDVPHIKLSSLRISNVIYALSDASAYISHVCDEEQLASIKEDCTNAKTVLFEMVKLIEAAEKALAAKPKKAKKAKPSKKDEK